MFDSDTRVLLIETAANLHHASRAGNCHRISFGIPDILQLIMEYRLGYLAVLDTECTGHAAATVAVLHLHKVRSCHLDELTRLLPNA